MTMQEFLLAGGKSEIGMVFIEDLSDGETLYEEVEEYYLNGVQVYPE